MKAMFILIAAAGMLGACNSISVKPGTMERGAKVHAQRGGYTMMRNAKLELESRGYDVHVGKLVYHSDAGSVETERVTVPSDVKYYIKVEERRERFRPVWCALNGFWWWNFNVSIADQKTGKELMTWRGRGCADSSIRLLRRTLDKLEGNTNEN